MVVSKGFMKQLDLHGHELDDAVLEVIHGYSHGAVIMTLPPRPSSRPNSRMRGNMRRTYLPS
jgi:hypothetical protein